MLKTTAPLNSLRSAIALLLLPFFLLFGGNNPANAQDESVALEREIDDLGQRIVALSKRQSGNKERFTANNAQETKLKGEIGVYQARVREFEVLAKRIDGQSHEVDQLETSIRAERPQVDRLCDRRVSPSERASAEAECDVVLQPHNARVMTYKEKETALRKDQLRGRREASALDAEESRLRDVAKDLDTRRKLLEVERTNILKELDQNTQRIGAAHARLTYVTSLRHKPDRPPSKGAGTPTTPPPPAAEAPCPYGPGKCVKRAD